MRKNISLIFSLLALIAIVTLLLDHEIKPDVKTLEDISSKADTPFYQAPNFAFTDISGHKSSLNAFKGKIVILHFWATWCPPCLVEFPKLVEISKLYKNDIVVLAISSDDHLPVLRQFADKNSISSGKTPNIHVIWDEDRKITHDRFQTFAYPETILIDGTGRMVRKIPGDADWTSPEMKSYLESLIGTLAGKPGTP